MSGGGLLAPMRPLQLPRRVVLGAVLTSTIGAIGVMPAAASLQRAVTAAIDGRSLGTVARWAALSAGVQLAAASVSLLGRARMVRRTKPAMARLRRSLLDAQTRLPLQQVVGTEMSGAQTVVIVETERIELYTEQLLGSVVPGVLLLLASALYVGTRDPLLALGCAVVAVPVLAVTLGVNRVAQRASVTYWAATREMNTRVLRFLRLQHLFVDLGLEEQAVRSEEPPMREFEAIALRQAQTHGLLVHGQTMVFAVGAAVMLVFSAAVVGSGRSSTGALLSILYALVVGQSAARMITGAQAYLMAGRDAAPRVERLLDATRQLGEVRGGRPVDHVRQIELRGVSFGYDDHPLIDDLSLTVRAGECVVITGPNGAGKSTVLRLLTGRVVPGRGDVLVDGVPIGALDLSSLRRRIGLVSQHPPFSTGTVRDDLRLVAPDAADDALSAVLDLVGLRIGLHHVVGEDAALLSGGQRQRLALARALLRDPDLVLLDEPGNHLDEDTAELLMRVRAARPALGVVVVSHDRAALDVPGARVVELVRR